MSITKQEVEKIQNIIKEDQKKEIQIKTRMESDMEFVKKEFGIDSVEGMEDQLDEWDKEIERLDKEIEEKGDALKKAHEWDI